MTDIQHFNKSLLEKGNKMRAVRMMESEKVFTRSRFKLRFTERPGCCFYHSLSVA